MNAAELRKKLIQLWTPLLLTEEDFHLEIGDLKWHKGYDYHGLYLHEDSPKELWKAYHDAHDTDPDYRGKLIIVSPIMDSTGNYLHEAVHEFTHLIRLQLESFYTFPPKVNLSERAFKDLDIFGRTLRGVPKERFNLWKKNVINHENQGLSFDQQIYLSNFIDSVFPEDKKPEDALFGKYSLNWTHFDCGHDPLFYFLFYIMHRKADDLAFFKTDHTPVASSTFYEEAPAKLVIQHLPINGA